MSPSGISCTPAPAPRTALISSAWRGRSRMQAVISEIGTPLALAMAVEHLGRRRVQIDDALRIAGTDGDLVHVHVGRIEQPAALGDRQHRQRIRHGLGADGGAFQRDRRRCRPRGRRRCRPPRRCRASGSRPSRLRRSRPGRGCAPCRARVRMASTAALSAAFSSPRPRRRAAAMAAASVTRATSPTRTRSSPPLPLSLLAMRCASVPAQAFTALHRLNTYHLRRLRHHIASPCGWRRAHREWPLPSSRA